MATSERSAEHVLRGLVEAWRGREELPLGRTCTVAFQVRGPVGGDYHVVLSDSAGGELRPGVPASWDIGYELDLATLRKLDSGELNALTAMGQARAGDPIPLVPKPGPGEEASVTFQKFFIPLSFHFWNRTWPEVVSFGEGRTRLVHGGNATVFFYQPGLRSAWYQLQPGMHINRDPADQTNEFPTLVIVTRGSFEATLGGTRRTLMQGEMVHIPAGMTHEFHAGADQYGEFVIIMFGAGA